MTTEAPRDTRCKNRDWAVQYANIGGPFIDSAQLAVLMDLRDELHAIKNALSTPPSTDEVSHTLKNILAGLWQQYVDQREFDRLMAAKKPRKPRPKKRKTKPAKKNPRAGRSRVSTRRSRHRR